MDARVGDLKMFQCRRFIVSDWWKELRTGYYFVKCSRQADIKRQTDRSPLSGEDIKNAAV